MGSATSFALRPGEGCSIVCNGATFVATEFSPPLLSGTVGVIEITDRITAAPSSPTAGARYIVTAAYSTFETHDIIEADGQGGFIEITPAADCGWIAYVVDEDLHYAFRGSAWAQLGSSGLQVFTASGTYTPTAGMTSCLAIVTGAGGGGGGTDSDGSSTGAGAGGGAGGTAIGRYTASQIGASQVVTIGAAGAAGANTGTDGGVGGDTTLGALATGGGGPGGTGNNATANQTLAVGVAGGTASGGLLNIPGGHGGPGWASGGGALISAGMSGQGGASFWGGGARSVIAVSTAAAGVAGTAYGSGGSGSANVDTAAGGAGGVGVAGVIMIVEFF